MPRGPGGTDPGTRLTYRAEVGRTVHEPLALDGGAAPRARPPLLAVDLQGPVEVAALPVDVDVQRVERGAALLQRRRHHVPHPGEHLPDLGGGQLGAEPVA